MIPWGFEGLTNTLSVVAHPASKVLASNPIVMILSMWLISLVSLGLGSITWVSYQ